MSAVSDTNSQMVSPEWIAPLKRRVPVVAWLAALIVGWESWNGFNLMDAVLRGAAAWLALIFVLRVAMGWIGVIATVPKVEELVVDGIDEKS